VESQRNQSACVKIPIIDAGPAGQAQRVPRPEPLCMTTERADMSAASPDRTYRTQSTVKRSAWLGPSGFAVFDQANVAGHGTSAQAARGARHEQRPMRPGPNSNQTCGPSNRFRLARIAATSSALTLWKWMCSSCFGAPIRGSGGVTSGHG